MSRRKNYERKDPSELSPLPPDWLNLPGVQVQGLILETERSYVVQAIARMCEEPKPACPKCDSTEEVNKADFRWGKVHDVERDGKLVCIVLGRQRGYCARCEKPFLPPLSYLDRGKRQRTRRLTAKGMQLSLERETTSAVAKAIGMSRRTAQSMASEASEERLTPREVFRRATEDANSACVIQIDDSHPSNGTNTAILLNARPWELLEEYSKKAIEDFFSSLKDRSKVRVYVCDMTDYLLDLGKIYFIRSLIVADPYHVLDELLENFDSLLEPLETNLVAEYIFAIKSGHIVRPIRARHISRKQQQKLKQQQKKQKENPEKDDPDPKIGEIKIMLHTKIKELNEVQRKAVKYILNCFPQIRAGYTYLQRVMVLYHMEMTSSKASNAFDKFERKMPEETRAKLAKFLDLCEKNRGYICAFWDCGWSNAEVEAQNGVIKRLDKLGCGLLFPEVRRQWLYGRSTTAILGEQKSSTRGGVNLTVGKFKKGIRALRTLSIPEPIPVARPGKPGWLFDLTSQAGNRAEGS